MNGAQDYPLDDLDFEWLEEVVRSAGEIALRHYRQVTASRKADRTLVTVVDHEVEDYLRQALSEAYPADGLLGEERGPRSGQSGRVWVVDPIDGTAAYAAGLPVWGVSVGLLQDWDPVAGIFYLPLLDEFYLSHGRDALFNGQTIQVDDSRHIDDESYLCVTSAAHRKYRIEFIGKTRAMGSTAANMCYVARGTAVAALVDRPSLWDIAGVLPVLRAAGGDLCYLSGHPLDLETLADGQRCPEPVLVGAPWALDYFAPRIEVIHK
jgi:myo-inositol-1(or 4)-monophosphatase